MIRHTRIKRVSDKRKATTGRQWSTITAPRKPVKRKKRKPSETLRIYGPKARREMVRADPCAACGIVGYSENAHVLGNDGMSRKAGYKTIAPLCGLRPQKPPWPDWYIGCHRLFDEQRANFDVIFPEFNPERAAQDTENRWLTITQEAKQA